MIEGNKVKSIKEAIYQTIVFFDIFDYPLTDWEIWRYLPIKISFLKVREVLQIRDKNRLSKQGAYYFLLGREKIIQKRNHRYNYTQRKIKRALRISRIFRFIPWIEMIAIGNIIGSHNLKDDSDIDFFIITKKNRIWISRFFTTLIAKLLLLRPRVNNVRDKICLSFYLSEDNLDLQKLHLPEKKDWYFIYWLSGLVPIYERNNNYQKLIDHNQWLLKFLPNWQVMQVVDCYTISPLRSWVYRDIVDFFLGGLETVVKKMQLRILPNDLRLLMNQDTRVVINDRILKLHVTDRRQKYLDLFQKRVKN